MTKRLLVVALLGSSMLVPAASAQQRTLRLPQPAPTPSATPTPDVTPTPTAPVRVRTLPQVQARPVAPVQTAPVTTRPAPVATQTAPVTTRPAPVIVRPIQAAPVATRPAPVLVRPTASGQADLVATALREENGEIVADVRNAGTAASAATTIRFTGSGMTAVEQPFAALRAGQSRTVRIARPAGAASVQLLLDTSAQVAESNETNNRGMPLALGGGRPAAIARVPAAPTPAPVLTRPVAGRPAPVSPPTPAAPAAPATVAAAGDEEAALVKRLGAPRAEGGARLSRKAGKVPRLLVDGVRAPLKFRCVSANRAGDTASLSKSASGQLSVLFSCGPSMSRGQASVYSITVQTGPKGALVPGRGPRYVTRGGPALSPNSSRAFAQINSCLDAFAQYKTGDYAFEVESAGAYPMCSVIPGSKVMGGASPVPTNFNPVLYNKPLPTAEMVNALIDGQRPEHMLHYNEFTIDGVTSRQVTNVAGEWLAPPGGLPPVNDPKAIKIATTGGYSVEFLTREKPAYTMAVLQLVRRSNPAGQPTTVKLGGMTVSVATGGALGSDFGPAQGGAISQCTTDLAPNGLIGMGIVDKLYSEKMDKGSHVGWAVQGPVWKSTISFTETQYKQLLNGRDKGNYWLRIVPVKKPKSAGAFLPDCAGTPGRPVPVQVGFSKEQMASYNKYVESVAQDALDKKAEDAALAAQAALPGGVAGSSPATVEVIGWLPPDSPNVAVVMTEVPKTSDPLLWFKDPKKFIAQPHAASYNLGDAYPSATWPSRFRGGWEAGKVYQPFWFDQAQAAKERLDDWYDYIPVAINGWSYIYSGLQKGLVDTFAYAVSLGKCEPDIPFEEPAARSKGCDILKGVGNTGLKIAMTGAGLPPTLPTTADLGDQAADYLVRSAMSALPDDLVGVLPADAKEEVAKWLAKRLKDSVLGMKCAQPADLSKTPESQGFDSIDPKTLCGYKKASFYSFARMEALPVSPTTATMFVRIKPNPKMVASADPTITLTAWSLQTSSPAYAQEALKRMGGGFSPLPTPVPLKIDMSTVPAEGIVVPITFQYPKDIMEWAFKAANMCDTKSAFLGPCIDGAHAFWRDLMLSGTQKMTVQVGYRFADDIEISETAATKKVLVATAPAIARYDAKVLTGSLGRVQPGLSYLIREYAPQPGFVYLHTKTAAGLPTHDMEPDFDLDDEY